MVVSIGCAVVFFMADGEDGKEDVEELILVEVPSWWKSDDGSSGQARAGQRNAAIRWNDHLGDHSEQMEFESLATLPSMSRHKTRSLALCAHVDDLVVGGLESEVEWCLGKMK